jgi:SPX domain protein involved in polyphosphate accumulation
MRPYVRPDRYSEFKKGGSYTIVSLYMDSDDLKLCRESLDGDKNRYKLRIRSYSDEPDYPRFFEIKRRINRIIVKSRARAMEHSVASLLAGSTRLPQDGGQEDKNLAQFIHYQNYLNAKPIVEVKYQRQAFESSGNEVVRITFDRELCFRIKRTPDVRIGGSGWQRVPVNGVVLEIKFTGRCPAWVSGMVMYLNIRQQSFSKYANSIKQACLLRFCAPKRFTRNLPWNNFGNLSTAVSPTATLIHQKA